MKFLRVAMFVLAFIHLAFTGLTALVGSFADGGTILDRVLVVVIHPVAAILLVVVLLSRQVSDRLLKTTLAVLLVAIVADILQAVLIGTGVTRGDWFLPLIFAIVPAMGVAYLSAKRWRGTGPR